MKLCPNNHENPDNANFCKVCGTQLDNSVEIKLMVHSKKKLKKNEDVSVYPPDVFPSINFLPKSVVPLNFHFTPWVVLIIFSLFAFFMILFYPNIIRNILDMDNWNIVRDGVLSIFILLAFWGCGYLTRSIYKCIRYHFCTQFIEGKAFEKTMRRIAKNGKLGLFDFSSKTILLTGYDDIAQFDSAYLVITKEKLKGIYSIGKRSIIIPVKYEQIDEVEHSIFPVHINGKIFHYDVNGNKMN